MAVLLGYGKTKERPKDGKELGIYFGWVFSPLFSLWPIEMLRFPALLRSAITYLGPFSRAMDKEQPGFCIYPCLPWWSW